MKLPWQKKESEPVTGHVWIVWIEAEYEGCVRHVGVFSTREKAQDGIDEEEVIPGIEKVLMDRVEIDP